VVTVHCLLDDSSVARRYNSSQRQAFVILPVDRVRINFGRHPD
jgi:hypothetical protein